jgi:acyl carrier protein
LASIQGNVNLRQQFDIDSMNFVNFLIALYKELHVDLPEQDNGQLITLDACVDYLLANRDLWPPG